MNKKSTFPPHGSEFIPEHLGQVSTAVTSRKPITFQWNLVNGICTEIVCISK